MKKIETRRQYTLEWDGDLASDVAVLDLEPDEGTAVLSRRGQRPTDVMDQMCFGDPDALDKFGDELKKVAAEMRKWPIHKAASK
jgi:hypothetical protein